MSYLDGFVMSVLFIATWGVMLYLVMKFVEFVDEARQNIRREVYSSIQNLLAIIERYRKTSKDDCEQIDKFAGEIQRDLEALDKKVHDLIKKK